MADIFSVVISAIGATQKSSIVIYKFIRGCKEARADLTDITQQLSELTLLLGLIKDTDAAPECLPEALQTQLKAMLASCGNSIKDIEEIIADCNGRTGVLKWTLRDKEKVTAIRVSLEAFKSGLSLALDTVNLSVAKEIKNNTDAIQEDTTDIKRDTEEILEQIQRLRIQLPHDRVSDGERARLEAWLDSLTLYAETVADDRDVNEIDPPVSGERRSRQEANENEVTRQPLSSTASEQTVASGVNRATPPAPITTPFQERTSTRSHMTASVMAHTTESGNAETQNSSYHFIASLPCAKPIQRMAGNVELQICVTLHDDSVVRVWSMQTKRLVKELNIDRRIMHYRAATISICPANPEIIAIHAFESRLTGSLVFIEVWHWADCRQIYSTDLPLSDSSWHSFMPGLSVIYLLSSGTELMTIDLDVPPGDVAKVHKVSLIPLGTSEKGAVTSNRGSIKRLTFISDTELFLVWKTPFLKRFMQREGKPKFFIEVARLFSVTLDEGQRAPLGQRYSSSIIKHARITAKFWLDRRVVAIYENAVTLENRTVTILLTQKSDSKISLAIHVIGLDTGDEVHAFDIDCGFNRYPWSRLIYTGTSWVAFEDYETNVYMIDVPSGHQLGTPKYLQHVFMKGSDGFFSAKQSGSEIVFWKTNLALWDSSR
ncbi:hypothetical protein E0Z10_g5264 [Xylaria hypoxylon]|uniref:Azaphilone pigments biosynthesis cluster protein L N-terminal domain-containing protein n=1 Tax=Xylaria hypoxylon TaxID=37992 RepID=A0A4Z0Z1P1_9PEZI|nr:hypothetical protein E0Z10_g5264 [Xylaria hypoxylon]